MSRGRYSARAGTASLARRRWIASRPSSLDAGEARFRCSGQIRASWAVCPPPGRPHPGGSELGAGHFLTSSALRRASSGVRSGALTPDPTRHHSAARGTKRSPKPGPIFGGDHRCLGDPATGQVRRRLPRWPRRSQRAPARPSTLLRRRFGPTLPSHVPATPLCRPRRGALHNRHWPLPYLASSL